jgi:hypothetical protein
LNLEEIFFLSTKSIMFRLGIMIIIDLLFYHRELQCLVAIDLKIDDFKPEYMGKMEFYLEALDRITSVQ